MLGDKFSVCPDSVHLVARSDEPLPRHARDRVAQVWPACMQRRSSRDGVASSLSRSCLVVLLPEGWMHAAMHKSLPLRFSIRAPSVHRASTSETENREPENPINSVDYLAMGS